MGEQRYAAFISYSSKDAAFARRLHAALESYRIPRSLGAFRLSQHSQGSNRAYPCFRDREELASGHLGPAIESALDDSGALIVVCSPHAAKSEWVDKEIRHFESLGRADRIFAIIADGEPGALEMGRPDEECFPPALRTEARQRAGERAPPEVVAGDARKDRDGFRNAWLKVLAGMIGVRLGQMLDRDAAQRRANIIRVGAIVAVAAVVLASVSTAWVLESRRAAAEVRQRLSAEMRSAFELEDAERAVTILAHLWPSMSADERERHADVLAAWWPRMRDRRQAIAALPDDSVFESRGRLFVKTREGVRALPFQASSAVAYDPASGAAYAIDASQRLWRAPVQGEVEEIALSVPPAGLYVWEEGFISRSGALVFMGAIRSSHEDYVELLIVDPRTGATQQSYANEYDLAQRLGCGDLGANMEEGSVSGEAERFVAACAAAPPRVNLDAPVMSVMDDAFGWRSVARAQPPPPDTADFVAMGEQRLRDGLGHFGGITPVLFAPRGSEPPVMVINYYHSGPVAGFEACHLPSPQAEMRCEMMGAHSHGRRFYERFIYAADRAESGQPLFWLVDRRDLSAHGFNDPSVYGLNGAPPHLTALSPSGSRFAAIVDGRILVFALDDDLALALTHDIAAGALGGVGGGAMTFVGEDQLIVARTMGLVVGFDIPSGRELWRFRLPGAAGRHSEANVVSVALSEDNARVAIRGDDFAVVLDADTGLPLAPLSPFDALTPRDEDELDRLAEFAEADANQRAAQLAAYGAVVMVDAAPRLRSAEGRFEADARFSTLQYAVAAGASPSEGEITRAPCRTGWRVRGDRVEPFDPLAALRTDGAPLTMERLARLCGG